jgi:glycosyltransferase involved in cell wall biosynthesis|tara:strand:- start:3237 stop:4328 length:1092 start_codon:yes stop_codon:yes gene_type:complete
LKKKVLIIFPDEWVAYSPTVLNLVEVLSPSLSVKVVAPDNSRFNNTNLDVATYHFIRIPGFISIMLPGPIYRLFKLVMFLYKLRRERADIVIGVDSVGMYTALKLFRKCNLLSLEIRRDICFRLSDKRLIESVMIQTKERFDFLFSQYPGKVFLVPNSPIVKDTSFITHDNGNENSQEPFRLIFLGTAIPEHGIYTCIDSIQQLGNIRLTVKGIILPEVKAVIGEKYATLLAAGHLIVDDDYLHQNEILPYLSRFDAGFCFYDFTLIKKNDFNYISCPSGKMFNYFGAGLPVIGSDILGLRLVKEFDAGILLQDISPASIAEAIHSIRADHATFQQNCIRAAKALDFHERSKEYVQFLTDTAG